MCLFTRSPRIALRVKLTKIILHERRLLLYVSMPLRARSISIAFNKIRDARIRRGLTQEELGKKAGYSVRLIRKVESGEPVTREAIANIVMALSTPDQPLTIESLVADNEATARLWMDAFNAHGSKMGLAVKHLLTEDFIFHCPGDPKAIPFAGD
jgi:transcriptional regulator with XRE-family HTH domain